MTMVTITVIAWKRKNNEVKQNKAVAEKPRDVAYRLKTFLHLIVHDG